MVSPNAKAQDTAVRSQLCQEVKAGATQIQILQKPENAAQACDPTYLSRDVTTAPFTSRVWI